MNLEEKLVGEINGTFFIPSYQRGYRWTPAEVWRLLNDLHGTQGRKYCLQPLVVKKRNDGSYELVDGQQRLTTIYIILTTIKEYKQKLNITFRLNIPFRIEYEMRADSADYLKSLDAEHADSNIDFHYMNQAHIEVEKWLEKQEDPSLAADEVYGVLEKHATLIWYEVDRNIDGVELFERLNIGKIPLTNSELVKALFLSSESALSASRKAEIALLWDRMEIALHDEDMWSFLGGDKTGYETRMDLVLGIISSDLYPDDNYGVFFEFHHEAENNGLGALWKRLVAAYQQLEDWYKDSGCYHRIGYLMLSASREGRPKLKKLYREAQNRSKSEFISYLDGKIRECVGLDQNRKYIDLSYEEAADQRKIHNILLLFNVLTTMKEDGGIHRFPFSQYRGEVWSLEHIHAQQSQGINTEDGYRKWLESHRKALNELGCGDEDGLEERIDATLKKTRVDGKDFKILHDEVVKNLSAREAGENKWMHSILNLALLECGDNSALNNSVFAVKRRRIIEMDQSGTYIPPCTRNIFLKYYSLVQDQAVQFHFWSDQDRNAYKKALNAGLGQYLCKEI